ncbi:hypothetical protein [Halorarum halobium]|uniref:hypothetical protein n=1 Tax=Halorarum halobium TaxID=3075121 RepID=UPI0028B18DD5|nr:hypothetical protein [Halobaculum sp. XH14]
MDSTVTVYRERAKQKRLVTSLVNQRRIGDVLLGVTMILIGGVPLGLTLTGRGHLMAGDGFGALSGTLNTLLVVGFVVCGLVVAAAGVIVVRNGRSGSETTSLH